MINRYQLRIRHNWGRKFTRTRKFDKVFDEYKFSNFFISFLVRIFEDRKLSEDDLRKVEKQIDIELNQTQHLLTGMNEDERAAFLTQQQMFMDVTNDIETIELDIQECEKQEAR